MVEVLFVPTPSESPADYIAECSKPQESLRFYIFPSMDLNCLGHDSTFCGRVVESDTEICDNMECTTIINVPEQVPRLSLMTAFLGHLIGLLLRVMYL